MAETAEERERGLMFRTELAEDAGMVFLYGDAPRTGFWMRNTLLPLSAAFFDDSGAVIEIVDMEPCRADPCPIHRPDAPYDFAVEVNRGRFAELGVDVGDGARLLDASP